MGSCGRESELVLQLIEAGNSLLSPPPPSVDGLLSLLDEIEILLSNVEQDPPTAIQDALLPSMKALISADLLRHPDDNVRVSVVSCLTEITRITAPEAPYNDEQMKEIFQLTVEAFGKLTDLSSRSYRKAELVLDTVSRVRSFLLMLDLECDELILEMFQCFLKTISSNHPQVVVLAVESIMSMVIDESEEVSKDLLDMLLASVRKENENVSSMSWRLVEKVFSRCACKLKPYIVKALKSAGNSLDMYSPVVSSVCKGEPSSTKEQNTVDTKENEADEKRLGRLVVSSAPEKGTLDLGQSSDTNLPKNTSRPADDGCKQTMSDRDGLTDENDNSRKRGSRSLGKHCFVPGHSKGNDAEIKSETIPKKRGWKPNSLMNPEEGYDHSWISGAKGSSKMPSSKKFYGEGVRKSSLGKPIPKKAPLLKETKSSTSKVGKTTQTVVMSLSSLSSSLRGPRKRSHPKSEEICRDVCSLPSSSEKKEASSIRAGKEGLPSLNAAIKTELLEEGYLTTPSQEGFRKSKDGEKAVKSGKKAKKKAMKESVTEAKVLNTSGGSSVVLSNAKRKKLRAATLHQCIPGSSKSKKKMTAQIKTGHVAAASEEIPKSNPTRKRNARKEVDLETPHLGEELVGKRIKVWWPLDKTYYEGVVDSYDNVRKKHRVSYSDGDMEVLFLKRQRWELIEDDTSAKSTHQRDQEIDPLESSTLSDALQRQKVNGSKKTSATGKTTSSSKGSTSMRILKKKSAQKEFNEKAKRAKDSVIRKTTGTLKAETEEPETKEGESVKSLKELNAEPGSPELNTDKKQNVTQAVPEKKKEEACDENQELKTKAAEDQKSTEHEHSNAGPERVRDVAVPNVMTHEDKAIEVVTEKNTGVCVSETEQAREGTRNARRTRMQNSELKEKPRNP